MFGNVHSRRIRNAAQTRSLGPCRHGLPVDQSTLGDLEELLDRMEPPAPTTICRWACGFDGIRAPAETDRTALHAVWDLFEEAIRGIFAQEPIRRRLACWREEGLEVRPGTIDWLEGRAPLPDIPDVDKLDRFLRGANLVRKVAVERIVRAIAVHTWSRAKLLEAVGQVVGAATEPIVVEPPAGHRDLVHGAVAAVSQGHARGLGIHRVGRRRGGGRPRPR